MTCSLQDAGHCRPLSELTLLSWAVFILHGCFQPVLLVLVQLLGAIFFAGFISFLYCIFRSVCAAPEPSTIQLISSLFD